MINYLLILIFVGLIFFIILPKLIKENEIKKFKKINFLSIYLSLFVFSYISVSITYYFLGAPNISNSTLLEIKEKKQLVKQEQLKKIKKTKNDLKIINKMLQTDPQNLNLLLAKASMAAIIQDIETEIETLKKIIKINPITNVKSLLAQAYLRKNDGIVNEFIKKLIDEVLFEKPKDPGANFILAKYLNQNGNKNKSRNLLLKILKHLSLFSIFIIFIWENKWALTNINKIK